MFSRNHENDEITNLVLLTNPEVRSGPTVPSSIVNDSVLLSRAALAPISHLVDM